MGYWAASQAELLRMQSHQQVAVWTQDEHRLRLDKWEAVAVWRFTSIEMNPPFDGC